MVDVRPFFVCYLVAIALGGEPSQCAGDTAEENIMLQRGAALKSSGGGLVTARASNQDDQVADAPYARAKPPSAPSTGALGADVEVQVSVADDGQSATVLIQKNGNSRTYAMAARGLYAVGAKVLTYSDDVVKELPQGPPRTFVSRAKGRWASARLGDEGTVSGLFQVGRHLVRVQATLGASLLESDGARAVLHTMRPYAPQLLIAGRMNSSRGGPELVIDTAREGDLLFPADHVLPDVEFAMSNDEEWPGDEWWPGCYDGDSSLHALTVGFVADVEAYRKLGYKLQSDLEDILHEASFVYEMQMNIRLVISYLHMYTSESGAPSWAVGCGAMTLAEKLDLFHNELPSEVVGAHHLFTGCQAVDSLGVAWRGVICRPGRYNAGVTQLRGAGTFDTYAHELGHNIGADHSYEEGIHNTGGIMDSGDGFWQGVWQFNSQYRKAEMCASIAAWDANCRDGQFYVVDPSPTTTPLPTTMTTTTATTTTTTTTATTVAKLGCDDGLPLTPVATEDCPAQGDIAPCSAVSDGELCEGDGECGTDTRLDNCGGYDIYLKGTAAASTTTTPTTTTTTTTTAATLGCDDGLPLTPVAPEDCPAEVNIAQCSAVSDGELCEGDGECGTDTRLDNCGGYDIYLKGTAAASTTTTPTTTTTAPTPAPTPEPTTTTTTTTTTATTSTTTTTTSITTPPAPAPSGGYTESQNDKCPPGSEAIGTAELCEAAANELGLRYRKQVRRRVTPGGCEVYSAGRRVYFNTQAEGRAASGWHVLCKIAVSANDDDDEAGT